MAEHMTETELRTLLQNKDIHSGAAFSALRTIANLLNSNSQQAIGREMTLRALAIPEAFVGFEDILQALVRKTGLFPYADVKFLEERDLLAYELHRPASSADFGTSHPSIRHVVFHREQAEIFHRIMGGENVILSAPTSFGKSRIIDAVIASQKFRQIAIIVPTLALIDETRRRLSQFSDLYKIITHPSQTPAERNVFVLTAERAVANEKLPPMDFFVIDEFYKIGLMDEDESRTVALNHVFYRLYKDGGQFYLLGPNIEQVPLEVTDKFSCYFHSTNFSTVVVETKKAPVSGDKMGCLIELLKQLDEPTLIYCSSPAKANLIAHIMLETGIGQHSKNMINASQWLSSVYHEDWILSRSLPHSIGIHHGRLPRSIGQHVVRAFNEKDLQFLVCTSTLIEGVNTRAKNVVIYDNSVAQRRLDYFTFNNIKGRSGRMGHHFVGRVYLFETPPQEEFPFVDFPLVTQNDQTPESLLIQMEDADLSRPSKDRIEKYHKSPLLSMATLKRNSPLAPDAQLSAAQEIWEFSPSVCSMFEWTGYPTKIQRDFICDFLWKHFVDSSRYYGVYSGKQLSYKLFLLSRGLTPKQRILDELQQPEQYAPKSVDEAVERVFTFERSWAGFEFPRLLNAVSSIQKEVLTERGLPFGDYAFFAARVECLFTNPVVAALDEYGLPIQVGQKLQGVLGTETDLDLALENLLAANVTDADLTPYELELFKDATTVLRPQQDRKEASS